MAFEPSFWLQSPGSLPLFQANSPSVVEIMTQAMEMETGVRKYNDLYKVSQSWENVGLLHVLSLEHNIFWKGETFLVSGSKWKLFGYYSLW